MSHRRVFMLLGVSGVALALGCRASSLDDRERLEVAAAVEAATRSFGAVQRALDAEGAVAMLAPEYHMYVDGQYLTYDAVATGIRAGFAGAAFLETRFADIRVTVLGSGAAVSSFTFRDSTVVRDGAVVRNRGATTLVWARRQDRWLMVYGHADHYPVQ